MVTEISSEVPVGQMDDYQRFQCIFLLEVSILFLSVGLSNQRLSPLLNPLCRATSVHYNRLISNKNLQRRLHIYLLVAPNFDMAPGLSGYSLVSKEPKHLENMTTYLMTVAFSSNQDCKFVVKCFPDLLRNFLVLFGYMLCSRFQACCSCMCCSQVFSNGCSLLLFPQKIPLFYLHSYSMECESTFTTGEFGSS